MMKTPLAPAENRVWKIDEESFEKLKSGKVRTIIKVGLNSVRETNERDTISFFGRDGEFIVCRKERYPDFLECLKHEKLELIDPEKDKDTLLKELRKKYPRSQEHYGVYAFELMAFERNRKPIAKIINNATAK